MGLGWQLESIVRFTYVELRHPAVASGPASRSRAIAVSAEPTRSISRTNGRQLRSPAELAAVVRASTHHEFSRLGAANRAFAAACGPVLGELWSAEMILQFAGAYDDCVSGREATSGLSYRC